MIYYKYTLEYIIYDISKALMTTKIPQDYRNVRARVNNLIDAGLDDRFKKRIRDSESEIDRAPRILKCAPRTSEFRNSVNLVVTAASRSAALLNHTVRIYGRARSERRRGGAGEQTRCLLFPRGSTALRCRSHPATGDETNEST